MDTCSKCSGSYKINKVDLGRPSTLTIGPNFLWNTSTISKKFPAGFTVPENCIIGAIHTYRKRRRNEPIKVRNGHLFLHTLTKKTGNTALLRNNNGLFKIKPRSHLRQNLEKKQMSKFEETFQKYFNTNFYLLR